jgi:hypothetical protein
MEGIRKAMGVGLPKWFDIVWKTGFPWCFRYLIGVWVWAGIAHRHRLYFVLRFEIWSLLDTPLIVCTPGSLIKPNIPR